MNRLYDVSTDMSITLLVRGGSNPRDTAHRRYRRTQYLNIKIYKEFSAWYPPSGHHSDIAETS